MAFKHRRRPNEAAVIALGFVAALTIAPAANADDTDPPTRVGRIALLHGTVSFHPSPDDDWNAAELNEPVAQSTAIWADAGGEVEIEIGAARVKLASGTELDIVQLDDQNVILSVPQGRADVSLHGMAQGERYDLQTPRGDVDLLSDGKYRVIAGTDTEPTRVASFSGQAQLVGSASSITVAANQEMVASAGTPVAYNVADARQDAFDGSFYQAVTAVYARPVPAYVPPVPGVAELSAYGTWRDDGHYGHVWVPTHVDPGWQPYRHGHWGFVAPWGYTWIDDAPWGFAPFHYGRWVSVGGTWSWVPVERGVTIDAHYRPVYAPAMVTFIGNPAALTAGVAGVSASVGWVPLGPGEPWRPWYPHSDNYLRQANVANVNRTVITNITNTTVITKNTTYINQRAAVVVPQAAFAGGRPVTQVAYRLPPAALERPIEPARRATIEKVLPPPVAPAAQRQAQLPPAPKLAMAHPAAASAAAFHAHPPPAATGPRSAIPKPGSNLVPAGTVIPPAAKPRAALPAAEVANPASPEAHPAAPGKPETVRPGIALPRPGAPEAAKPLTPGEAVKPDVAAPSHSTEPVKPDVVRPGSAAPHQAEPPGPAGQRPETVSPQAAPGTAAPHAAEPAKPDVVRPGATGPHQEDQPRPAGQRPETVSPRAPPEAPKPGAAAPHAGEPGNPGAVGAAATGPHQAEQPKPEAQRPEPAKPATMAPHPAEASKPGATGVAEPAHPAPGMPAAHPQVEAPKPGASPAAEPKPAGHSAAERTNPAPHPGAAEPMPHKPGEHPASGDTKQPE